MVRHRHYIQSALSRRRVKVRGQKKKNGVSREKEGLEGKGECALVVGGNSANWVLWGMGLYASERQ